MTREVLPAGGRVVDLYGSSAGQVRESADRVAFKKQLQDNKDLALHSLVLMTQNPTQKMDPLVMAQLVQVFSSSDAAFKQTELLGQMRDRLDSLYGLFAHDRVGTTVEQKGDSFTVDASGECPTLAYVMPKNVTKAEVIVVNAETGEVRVVLPADRTPGRHVLNFEEPLPEGSYRFQVSATNAKGKDVLAETSVLDVVVAVEKNGGEWVLRQAHGTSGPLDEGMAVLKTASENNLKGRS